MNRRLYFLGAFALSIMAVCNPATALKKSAAHNTIVKLIKGRNIYYGGIINLEGFELFKKLYRENTTNEFHPKLVVTSLGGNSLVAIAMGQFIHEKKIPIRVEKICLFDCARYLFPAAPTKYIASTSIVGFHILTIDTLDGRRPIDEFLKKKPIPNMERIDKVYSNSKTTCHYSVKRSTKFSIKEVIRNSLINCAHDVNDKQKKLYTELGIDLRFPNMGIEKFKKAKRDGIVEFFYYDRASLQALGIKNITYGKNWDPSANSNYKYAIEIKLSDWQQL